MAEGSARDDAFRSAMERLPVAVVIVDGHQRLQAYNRRAVEMFAREGIGGDLLASRPSHPLAAVVSLILEGSSKEAHTVVFPSGTAYQVSPSSKSPKGMGRWLMLLVSRLSEGTAEPETAYNFTRREAEVAALLIGGRSTEEICSAMSISRETLKTHTRRLFEKTATRNRAELVARLLRLRS